MARGSTTRIVGICGGSVCVCVWWGLGRLGEHRVQTTNNTTQLLNPGAPLRRALRHVCLMQPLPERRAATLARPQVLTARIAPPCPPLPPPCAPPCSAEPPAPSGTKLKVKDWTGAAAQAGSTTKETINLQPNCEPIPIVAAPYPCTLPTGARLPSGPPAVSSNLPLAPC